MDGNFIPELEAYSMQPVMHLQSAIPGQNAVAEGFNGSGGAGNIHHHSQQQQQQHLGPQVNTHTHLINHLENNPTTTTNHLLFSCDK